MRDAQHQPDTSLLFYNSAKSYLNNKLKRTCNLKEIFKHKSKQSRSPKNNDTDAILPQSYHLKERWKNQEMEANRLSETKKPSFISH